MSLYWGCVSQMVAFLRKQQKDRQLSNGEVPPDLLTDHRNGFALPTAQKSSEPVVDIDAETSLFTQRMFIDAETSLHDKKYSNALRSYSEIMEALHRAPADARTRRLWPIARNGMGLCYSSLGRPDLGMKAFTNAIESDHEYTMINSVATGSSAGLGKSRVQAYMCQSMCVSV